MTRRVQQGVMKMAAQSDIAIIVKKTGLLGPVFSSREIKSIGREAIEQAATAGLGQVLFATADSAVRRVP